MGDVLGIVSVAAITIICYLIGEFLKAWNKFDDRKIPVIMGICGAIIGVISFCFAPSIMPTDNIIVAIAIGIVSGFAATGIDQIMKQASKES